MRSQPADGATLAESPKEVRLWFTETLVLGVSTFHVTHAHGEPVSAVEAHVDPADSRILVLSLPSLPQGAYAVSWRVSSVSDAHLARGYMVFGVNAAASDATPVGAEESLVQHYEAVPAALELLALIALFGAVTSSLLVLGPAAKRATPGSALHGTLTTAVHRAARWTAICALAAATAAALLFAWRVAEYASATPDESLRTVAQQLLGTTQWGELWMLRELLLVWAAFVTAPALKRFSGPPTASPDGESRLGLLVLICAVVSVLEAAGSHAATAPFELLAVSAVAVHLLAAGAWAGGIFALIVVTRARQASGESPSYMAHLAAIWKPFTRVAALSVALLLATGLFRAGQEVASAEALVSTGYGRALLAKFALVVAMGVFGLASSVALHRRTPASAADLRPTPTGPVWRAVRFEAAIALAVIALTGIVVSLASPRPTSSEAEVPTVATHSFGDITASIDVKPNRPGANVMTLRVVGTRKPAPAPISDIAVRFTRSGTESTSTLRVPQLVEPGIYRLDGGDLVAPGPWHLDVVVHRSGLPTAELGFDWSVRSPASGFQATPASPGFHAALLAGSLLALLGAAIALLSQLNGRRPTPTIPLQAKG